MARPLRLNLAGGLYHVSTQGEEGRKVFGKTEDREVFLATLEDVCRRFRWQCYAYCLLDDHYRLVVHTPEANLSKGMRQLNGVVTQEINRRQGTSGHVFHGRFKAVLIEAEPYLLEVCRDVVRRPVELRKAKDPSQWAWSSYKPTAGLVDAPGWLHVDGVLDLLGKPRKRAQTKYVEFVKADHDSEGLWVQVQRQIYLGSEAFVKRMTAQLQKKGGARSSGPANPKTLASFLKRYSDQKEAMAQAYLSGQFTLLDIATHYGLHYSSVSRAVKAYEKSMVA